MSGKTIWEFYFCSTHSGKFGVPLIIWGESPQIEYGGPASSKNKNILGREWLEELAGF